MERLVEMCKQVGLSGKDALDFIKEQQEIQQKEREFQLQQAEKEEKLKARELEIQRETRQHEAFESEKRRQHELEMKKFEFENRGSQNFVTSGNVAKLPDLPPFLEHKDDLDNYLDRFERFAKANGWSKDCWAVCLSNLLTGQALDTYSRLPREASTDYDAVKLALIKRYGLTEEGYLAKFRQAIFDSGSRESAEQFIVRLRTYLERWIRLSEIEETYGGLQDLIVKEQFFKACPKELEVYLREKGSKNLDEIIQHAEQYCVARENANLRFRGPPNYQRVKRCFNCNQIGHMKWNCPRNDDD